jgi:hypothetical protein
VEQVSWAAGAACPVAPGSGGVDERYFVFPSHERVLDLLRVRNCFGNYGFSVLFFLDLFFLPVFAICSILMHFAAIFLRLYRLLFFLPQAGKHAMDILISQRPMGLSLRTVIGSKGFGGLLLIFKTRSRWLFRCSGTLC